MHLLAESLFDLLVRVQGGPRFHACYMSKECDANKSWPTKENIRGIDGLVTTHENVKMEVVV